MNAKTDDTILEAVLAIAPEKRAAYLDQACGQDSTFRQRLEALIHAHETAGTFMAEPAVPATAVPFGAALTEKPGDKIGHYRLLEQIGEGGCGAVYMAEQQEPIRRRVAFKVIKLGMDTRQVIARFEAERQALALMDHPNIAKVLDAGTTDTGRPYFVMELVRGLRITEYCDQNKLSTEARLDLFIQVCHAVQHAHEKGIIHRDLKPSNILVTVSDRVPVPKVIDFGIAKATGGQQLTDKTLYTAFEQFIGTPAYMSPEQAEMTSLDIDTRSDIYALGVLLYELLTGHTPFDSRTLLSAGLDEMRRIIREQEPLRPSTRLSTFEAAERTTIARRRQSELPRLIHQIRGDLDWIVMKCLDKDRSRRYRTALELAADLQRHRVHRPVSAAAPTLRVRATKFLRRNRIAAAFIIVLAAGTVISTWQAVRANRARALAEQRATEARDHLYNAYVAVARSSRVSGEPGRRFAALEAVRNAARIRVTPELRSEAASALALVDLRPAREWQPPTLRTLPAALDAHFENYASTDEQGNLRVCRLSDDQCMFEWKGKGQQVYFRPRFSPVGQFLAAQVDSPRRAVQIWNLQTCEALLAEPLKVYSEALDFSPTAALVAANNDSGVVRVVDLTSGQDWSWASDVARPQSLCFRPPGKELVIADWESGLKFHEVRSGQLTMKLPLTNACGAACSPDGRWLCGYDEKGYIYLWDISRGAVLEAVIQAHHGRVCSVCFDPESEMLLTQSWDRTSALWSLADRRLLLRWPQMDRPAFFSADGRQLGPAIAGRTVRLLEVARAPEYRLVPAKPASGECNAVFSPDGRWILMPAADALECWDAVARQRAWSQPATAPRFLAFSPGGTRLLLSDQTGIRDFEWLSGVSNACPSRGTARRLPIEPPCSEAEYSRDGSVLVISQMEGLYIFRTNSPHPKVFPMLMCNFASVSPDARWAAASSWRGAQSEFKVWELSSGREVLTRSNFQARVGFGPDGRWLLIVSDEFHECLETGTWKSLARVPREPGAGFFALAPKPCSPSPIGLESVNTLWAALQQGKSRIQLTQVPALRPILTLDTASESPMCFDPAAARLLTRRSDGRFCIWDLRLVRQQLAALGVDWQDR